jgi:hypothetical protein
MTQQNKAHSARLTACDYCMQYMLAETKQQPVLDGDDEKLLSLYHRIKSNNLRRLFL